MPLTQPGLAVIELSESFHAVWDDLAAELELTCEHTAIDTAPAPGTIALLVAAGGEEHRAVDLLRSLSYTDGVPVFVVGATPSHRFAVEAMRRGAADYFALPQDLDLLRRTLAARAEAARERRRPSGPQEVVADPFHQLLGRSQAMRAVLEDARRIIQHGDVTVLIRGETGSGKELLARALHDGGPRTAGPFVAVNCAAIPSELMESEVFGHERGAFTDAHTSKPGLFEEAHGGTLFLDEIGHLPLHLQGKLLRALEERRVRRVGATKTREVDVRIISATHRDLADAVAKREFREDLYYRMNVVSLSLPPLRERGDDVTILAEAFAKSLADRYGLPHPTIGDDARATLTSHSWPGNVRELRHAIERALLLSEPGTLDPAHLVPQQRDRAAGLPFPVKLDDIITAAAREAVERLGGNKSAAARQLGISRTRLQRLLERGGE